MCFGGLSIAWPKRTCGLAVPALSFYVVLGASCISKAVFLTILSRPLVFVPGLIWCSQRLYLLLICICSLFSLTIPNFNQHQHRPLHRVDSHCASGRNPCCFKKMINTKPVLPVFHIHRI